MIVALDGLLKDYRAAASEEERQRVAASILERYNVTAALLVLDMSGFSTITREKGIVHFLAMVQRMQETTAAELEKFGGKVVKFFSDNCFAWFEDPRSAVECAVAICEAHHQINMTHDNQVQVCIGLDYGEFLLLEGKECFGHTVNRACKLGEDLADKGEILVSARLLEQIPEPLGYEMEAETFTESGIEIAAYSLMVPH